MAGRLAPLEGAEAHVRDGDAHLPQRACGRVSRSWLCTPRTGAPRSPRPLPPWSGSKLDITTGVADPRMPGGHGMNGPASVGPQIPRASYSRRTRGINAVVRTDDRFI